jgi:cyclic beta-1,2-glucan synthetase
MAAELLRYSDARLDPQRLDRFMNAFQSVAPLSIGELWAWPSMLKLALIDHLRRLSEELLESRAGRREADHYFTLFESTQASGRLPPLPAVLHIAFVDQLLQRMREYGAGAAELRKRLEARLEGANATVEDAVRAEHQRLAMNHVSMSNSITSLRLCSTLDWNEHVESASLIEQILRRDPPGIYARMDFASRDRYRHAVEALAEPSGEGTGQGRPARDRERPPGGGNARHRSAHGTRRLPPHRRRSPRARDRRRQPPAPARATRAGAPRARDALLPGLDRHDHGARRRRCRGGGARGGHAAVVVALGRGPGARPRRASSRWRSRTASFTGSCGRSRCRGWTCARACPPRPAPW